MSSGTGQYVSTTSFDKAPIGSATLLTFDNRDGVVNPSAAYPLVPFPAIFLAGVPISSFITRPGGLFEKVLNGFISTSTFVGSAGTASSVSADRVIPALSAVYLFATFALGGASSAGAIAMSSPNGRDNTQPRAQIAGLRGLPLRMHSAASHLIEVFPSYALAASLTATFAPTNQHLLNLLGLHVIAKLLIFWPSYLLNIDAARSLSHVLATSSLISVAWKLTFA